MRLLGGKKLSRIGGVLIGSHVDNTDPLAAAAADGLDTARLQAEGKSAESLAR